MDRQEIINKVKLKMDELGPQDGTNIIEPSNVDSMLDYGVIELLLMLPAYIPTPAEFANTESTGAIADNGDGTGYVLLPAEFLKLVVFKMTDWQKPITELITENHPRYILQKNQWTRGGISKPVGVYRYEPGIGKVLEYYSLPDGSTPEVEKALCIVSVVAEELEETLIDPLTWLVAGELLSTFGEGEQAKQAFAMLQNWINLKTI